MTAGLSLLAQFGRRPAVVLASTSDRRLVRCDVLGPSLLAGAGSASAFVSVTIAAVTGTEPHEAGLASGLINTSQQVGGALGLAILATVANSRTQSLFHAGVHSSAVATDQRL